MKTKPAKELLDEIYLESDNKQDIDYYVAIANLVMESIEARSKNGMTQKDLATAMGTMQSAISRFEKMGREPGFKFLARMAQALGHAPGVTLYGDFMATVKPELQDRLKEIVSLDGKTTKTYLNELLNDAVEEKLAETPIEDFTLQVVNFSQVVINPERDLTIDHGEGKIVAFKVPSYVESTRMDKVKH